MRKDQIFVLLLVVLLPMSGCFDGGGVGEADAAQDSTSTDEGSTSTGGTTSTPSTTNSQERTWYSSGGIYNPYWTDGQTAQSGQQRCVDYGPTYSNTTGEYIGEDCRETDYPDEASDWNVTSCTDEGGFILWNNLNSWQNGSTNNGYRYAPTCYQIFTTINTSSGEALLIYESTYGMHLRTTCDGVSSPTNYATSNGGSYSISYEYNIVQGSAMDCSHEFYRVKSYANFDISSYDYLWSLVYAIQDTTVV